MEELIGIYKGLRMPLLGLTLIIMSLYVFRPSAKKGLEQARLNMLDDDVDQDLSAKYETQEEN